MRVDINIKLKDVLNDYSPCDATEEIGEYLATNWSAGEVADLFYEIVKYMIPEDAIKLKKALPNFIIKIEEKIKNDY